MPEDFEEEFERKLEEREGELEEETLETEEIVESLEEVLQGFVSDLDELRDAAASTLEEVEEARQEIEEMEEGERVGNFRVAEEDASKSLNKLKDAGEKIAEMRSQLKIDFSLLENAISGDKSAIKAGQAAGEDLDDLRQKIAD
jgi:chromosome segregation ATPase